MTNDLSTPVNVENKVLCERPFYYSLCWKAIWGGTIAAIGIHILLTALGVAGGLAIFTPITDADPVSHFSIGAAVVWSVCAIIALLFGGMIAGRFSHSLHSGFVHGILVWSLSLIIAIILASVGSGIVLAGAMKVLGMGTKVVAAGAGEVAKEGIKRGADQVMSFVDEAVGTMGTNGTPGQLIRAKRDIGFAVTKLFTPGNDVTSADSRKAVTQALVSAGMSEADAKKMLDDWTMAYNNLKTELDNAKQVAEQKAREAADKAASKLACAAIWVFFSLLLGLLAAALGGRCAAQCAMRHENLHSYP